MRAPLTCAIVLSLLMAGCATPATHVPGPYGNFVANAPAQHETQLAADAARQLQRLYPPAMTRLSLRHASDDRFGQQLVERLRTQGYAVQQPATKLGTATSTGSTQAVAPSTDAAGIPFSYVLDAVTSPKLYRVTLMLGSQTLTRAYSLQSDTVHAAGAWVRKE